MAFDLLQDFWPSLSQIGIAGLSPAALDADVVENDVRDPLRAALDDAIGPVDSYDFQWLRDRAADIRRDDEFCITLDHGAYFVDADFQLDLSRTAPDLRHTGSESLNREPRETEDIPTQLAKLGSDLSTSRKRRIVLTDDGISTGTTLRMVLELCGDYGIDVRRIVVCCDHLPLESIGQVKVHSILKRSPGRPWLNERDLYWGLPRSGLTLAPHGHSIPFSLDARFVRERIGVESRIEEFRSACLRANIRLWELFEQQTGTLHFEDCPPLRMVPRLLGHRHERHGPIRVVDVLTELLEGNDAVDFDAPTAAACA